MKILEWRNNPDGTQDLFCEDNGKVWLYENVRITKVTYDGGDPSISVVETVVEYDNDLALLYANPAWL